MPIIVCYTLVTMYLKSSGRRIGKPKLLIIQAGAGGRLIITGLREQLQKRKTPARHAGTRFTVTVSHHQSTHNQPTRHGKGPREQFM